MMIEHSFPSDFEFEVLSELHAGNTRRLFFPGAVESGGRDGLNISVRPRESEVWIGTFASGRFGPKSVTGVIAAPNPLVLCVIVEGQAYMVDVADPESHQSLPIIPVIGVRSSIKHRLLIFANHTELLAIGATGIAWRSGRLSWDSLKLTTMTDDALNGVFWDVQTESEQGFTVDLATGSHTGGASVPI